MVVNAVARTRKEAVRKRIVKATGGRQDEEYWVGRSTLTHFATLALYIRPPCHITLDYGAHEDVSM